MAASGKHWQTPDFCLHHAMYFFFKNQLHASVLHPSLIYMYVIFLTAMFSYVSYLIG